LTVGTTVDSAAWWFVSMERTCESQILAESCRTAPKLIAHETAELTHNQSGSEKAGWFSFQALYNWIAEQEPDLFN
jgi:ribulose-5-phosphate 4-epimerase/fuculose-1-phosphate aldolase